jgi:hypothetical protein
MNGIIQGEAVATGVAACTPQATTPVDVDAEQTKTWFETEDRL